MGKIDGFVPFRPAVMTIVTEAYYDMRQRESEHATKEAPERKETSTEDIMDRLYELESKLNGQDNK